MTSIFSRSGLNYAIFIVIIGILNWLFWLVAAKLVNSDEIGLASSIFSTPVLFSSVALLGIEYTLLKNASKDKTYFGSVIIFEIIAHIILIPILIMSVGKITHDNNLLILSLVILFSSLFNSITNFSLLGILYLKTVVIVQTVAAIVKILLLILFLNFQLGVNGILLSLISQFFISGLILSIRSFQEFGLHLRKDSLKTILISGISNFPSKIAYILQSSGSITILAFIGIPHNDIGVFMISYGFITFISGISQGLSQISISSSTKEQIDLSYVSNKMSIAFTVPLITIFVIVPSLMLQIYNVTYSKYYEILLVLSLSLIPYILKTNAIAMLNNIGSHKKLSLLGILESVVFLTSILILAPSMGVIGASWSVVIAGVSSGILSLIWVSNAMRKIFFMSIISLGIGYLVGFLINNRIQNEFFTAIISFVTSIAMLFALRLIRFSDISFFIKQLRKH